MLELRTGTQPANPRLLFTAAITAGPTGGTTSLLLHQMPIADLFNPAVPAAGWVTVRSSSTAFSLGGGCGRNNLIDFPFINNFRPEILRITGTTQQVITLGIIGNDQYDSIDCVTQRDGRVLYMLTNRTRQRLELRREQGGLLQLVRDNFGTVITPFVGGMRPSIARVTRRSPLPASRSGDTSNTGAPADDGFAMILTRLAQPDSARSTSNGLVDDEELSQGWSYDFTTIVVPAGPTGPKESTTTSGAAIGPTRDDNLLWGDYFTCGGSGCTQTEPSESLGSAGPFGLYTWAGVSSNQVSGPSDYGGSGPLIAHSTLVTPNVVIVREGNQRSTQPSPYAGRGGPVRACRLAGTEIESGQVLVGIGPTVAQVQHNILIANLAESMGRSGFEPPQESVPLCD